MELIRSLLSLKRINTETVSIALARPSNEVKDILAGKGEFDRKEMLILMNMLGMTPNGRLSDARVHTLRLERNTDNEHIKVLSSVLGGGLVSYLEPPRSFPFMRNLLTTHQPYALQSKKGVRLVVLAKKNFLSGDIFDIGQFQDFSWGGGNKARSTMRLQQMTADMLIANEMLRPIDFDNIFTLRSRNNITWSDILKLAHKKGLTPARLAAIIEAIPSEGEVPEITVVARDGVTVKTPRKVARKVTKKPAVKHQKAVEQPAVVPTSKPLPAQMEAALSSVSDKDFTLDDAFNAIAKAA